MDGSSLLLVDSNPHRASILDFFLVARGFVVQLAHSAAEARHASAMALPSAIVVVHEPDGIVATTLVPALRQLVGAQPVVVVVGIVDCPDADAQVLRPAHPIEIVEAVRGALRRRVAGQPSV